MTDSRPMTDPKPMTDSKPMAVPDTMLSAFLDAELSAPEMEQVRSALAEDESLADRLAELALVDQLVSEAYAPIARLPMPQLPLAAAAASPARTNVIQLSRWRRAASQPLAMAASVALAIALVITMGQDGSDRNGADWQQVAATLDSGRSGVRQQLDDNTEVVPQLSFINREGEYCRQFYRAVNNSAELGIACRNPAGWQLLNSVPVQQQPAPGAYQTASADNALDQLLDDMLATGPLDAAGEADAINRHWLPGKLEAGKH